MSVEFSIQPYLNNVEILRQTAEQIKKDFSFFDIQLSLQADNYDELYNQLLPSLAEILKNNSQKIYAILYRIDISEIQLKNESQKNNQQTAEEIITTLIIKRCLQKVVLKKLFSS